MCKNTLSCLINTCLCVFYQQKPQGWSEIRQDPKGFSTGLWWRCRHVTLLSLTLQLQLMQLRDLLRQIKVIPAARPMLFQTKPCASTCGVCAFVVSFLHAKCTVGLKLLENSHEGKMKLGKWIEENSFLSKQTPCMHYVSARTCNSVLVCCLCCKFTCWCCFYDADWSLLLRLTTIGIFLKSKS